jgi:hypothetical protein
MKLKKYLGYTGKIMLLLVMVLPLVAQPGQSAAAQTEGVVEALTDYIEPSGVYVPEFLAAPPEFTPEQQAALIAAEEMVNRPGPGTAVVESEVAGPAPGTETVAWGRGVWDIKGDPEAAGDFTVFRKVKIHNYLPGGVRSNVSEVSVAGVGRNMFATGNWWAARSTNGGNAWTYINPYADMGDFCCDQIVYYDKARNLTLWLKMGIPASGWYYRIYASPDNGATWWYYTFDPGQDDINPVYDLQYDYPHWKITNDYIYLMTNIFSERTNAWWGTRTLKLPLDALVAGVGFGYSYLDEKTYFNATPVHGALDTMYWATHINNTTLRVYEWQEASGTIYTHNVTVPAWTYTNRGDAQCTAAGTKDFAKRTDDRVLAGWYSPGHYWGQANPVVGFMWNVQEGGGFVWPYIEAALINTSTWTAVRRPYVFNSSYCFLYPSMAVNSRSHLALVMNYGLNEKPNIGVALFDDYTASIPPGWTFYTLEESVFKALDNKWGDYNTVYPNSPADVVWHGGAHVLQASGSCCDAQIYFFVFGRERDFKAWDFWRGK